MIRIKELREAKGIQQKELAIDIGVSQPTVSDWESGRKVPSAKSTQKLADYFGVSVDYLLGRSELEPWRPPASGVKIKVYGTVPAGVPLEAIEDIIGTEEIPADWTHGGKEYFGLRVKGDSMYPKYMDGDIIIVRKQDTCDSGQDCVVYVNGYDATLKQVKLLPDGGVRLQPLNPSYAPKTYYENDESITIAGVVVEIRRKP